MAMDTASEDQRKRTMEALERRFATARAEAHQQMNHGKKRSLNGGEKEMHSANSSAIASSLHLSDTPVANSPNVSSKKGHFTFSGYTTLQEVEESGPTYSQLSRPIHENLLSTNVEPSCWKGSTVDKVLHELFQSGDSAQKYLQGSRSMKIDNWILLDNYVQGRGVSIASHVKALRTHSKRSRKHMSMKKLKKSGSFYLPRDLKKFEKYKLMHEMWKGYIMQLLKTTGRNQLAQCLLTADLHGANILVAECKITAFTGVSGIMIRETAETFGIVTRDDKFHVVPKKVSVFMFQVDCWKITLLGDKLTSRNLEA
ncbi:Ribonuclease P protein subunit p29 [Melia azedarach]|uniref:Ribonuclease P protein subunit p29 n=2 Tax=Melia azedarach TaxID=155640 RepID=A0ACC1X0R3_MELAZ|nr:Ribonuclease P protein subunit p29 [Melia azedarach]KAJ4704844.1 Ribonuclease P protein subunit p29 [Melia azedarach]